MRRLWCWALLLWPYPVVLAWSAPFGGPRGFTTFLPLPTTTTWISRRRSRLTFWQQQQHHHHHHHQEEEVVEMMEDKTEKKICLWQTFLQRFQGDFDNYEQVRLDRQQGLLPREGGGHEHIHCTLWPLSECSRLAAFYFDGQPAALFRFRYYQLQPIYASTTSQERDQADSSQIPAPDVEAIDTILYTLHPDLEKELRMHSLDPSSWPGIFLRHVTTKGFEQSVQLLPNCEVRWSWHLDPIQHAYAQDYVPPGLATTSTPSPPHPNILPKEEEESPPGLEEAGMHAYMVHGQALVESQVRPGQRILIRDQLSLWPQALWIHDRGFNPETGAFIYGNQRGIPYRLQRVTQMVVSRRRDDNSHPTAEHHHNCLDCERRVVNPDIAWTLGPSYRSDDEYQSKMAAIGGPSVPTRR